MHYSKPSKASLVLYRAPGRLITDVGILTGCQLIPPSSLTPMEGFQSYVLLQKGQDPFHTSFEDLDGLTAFTL